MPVLLVGMSPVQYKSIFMHSHSAWEIVYNLEGKGTTMIGDTEYDFSPGAIICQPPDVKHGKISEDVFRDIFLETDTFPLKDIMPAHEPLIFRDNEEKSFYHLISLAHKIYHENGFNCRALVESLYDSMCQLLLSWSAVPVINPEIRRVRDEIVRQFSDPEFSVAELLKDVAYHRDYFNLIFKQEMGLTPKGYLQELRINNAKRMLSNNDLLKFTIEEIAAMSGFYDAHYFHRVFRKITGMTPGEYAKQ